MKKEKKIEFWKTRGFQSSAERFSEELKIINEPMNDGFADAKIAGFSSKNLRRTFHRNIGGEC